MTDIKILFTKWFQAAIDYGRDVSRSGTNPSQIFRSREEQLAEARPVTAPLSAALALLHLASARDDRRL